MPGGVSSPVRAFASVGGEPFFAAHGAGQTLTDVDDNDYIDYVQSWGALLLGHAHPDIVAAVRDAAGAGTSFGTSTALEVELARLVTHLVPNAEMVRFVSSGTEAAMTAARLARGVTHRDKIIKFAGCYHGHSDAMLASAGSGVATLGIPESPGVPFHASSDTIVVPYNDLDAFRAALDLHDEDVAAVFVEPIAANMGVVEPMPGYLRALRELTSLNGSLLIFDEVITGFRVASGGAQQLYGIDADLILLGKILGGGLPVGAVAGRSEILERLVPSGPIYQAGTLAGNPVTMAAGLAMLSWIVRNPSIYQDLGVRGRALADGLAAAARSAGHEITSVSVGALVGFFLGAPEVRDYRQASSAPASLHSQVFWGLLDRGIYIAPSRFEAIFLSTSHTDSDITYTVDAAKEILAQIEP